MEQEPSSAKKDILIVVDEDSEHVFVLSMAYPSVFSRSHIAARYAIIAIKCLILSHLYW